MAWRFGDTFDTYATSDLGQRYPSFGPYGTEVINVGTGRDGTNALRFGAAPLRGCVGRGITPTTATLFVHLALRQYASHATQGVLSFWNAAESRQQVLFTLNDNGGISARRGTSNEVILQVYGDLLGSTAGGLVPLGAYVHLGFAVQVHPSAGVITVYVNGLAQLTLTGLNTRNGTITASDVDHIIVGGTDLEIDDFVISDDVDTGDGCTAFLGDLAGERLLLTGDGATTQLTRSGGASNASCVDDPTPDGNATVVTGTTVGLTDLYTHSALTRLDTVRCLQIATVAKKSSGGTRAIAHVVRTGGVNYPQTDQALGTDYAAQISPLALNPETSAAWTNAEVDATELGPKVTV
jgi:hypothetical protein